MLDCWQMFLIIKGLHYVGVDIEPAGKLVSDSKERVPFIMKSKANEMLLQISCVK